MPDLLVRNLPAELHERLKNAAADHRRSVTQEAIEALKLGLDALPLNRELPPLIVPRGEAVTMAQLLHWTDDDLENRNWGQAS